MGSGRLGKGPGGGGGCMLGGGKENSWCFSFPHIPQHVDSLVSVKVPCNEPFSSLESPANRHQVNPRTPEPHSFSCSPVWGTPASQIVTGNPVHQGGTT